VTSRTIQKLIYFAETGKLNFYRTLEQILKAGCPSHACQLRGEVRTPTIADFGDKEEELKLFLEEKERLLEGDAQGEADDRELVQFCHHSCLEEKFSPTPLPSQKNAMDETQCKCLCRE
jgi:hypothetical protein